MARTNHRPSADETYHAQLAQIRATLKAIEAGLEHHEAQQAYEAGDWGYVGDLEAVATQLAEAARIVNAEVGK